MPVREIRRESFSHEGGAYELVVIDDGKRLTATIERDGRVMRAARFRAAPYGWKRYTSDEVDRMIDDGKQWIERSGRRAWTLDPRWRCA